MDLDERRTNGWTAIVLLVLITLVWIAWSKFQIHALFYVIETIEYTCVAIFRLNYLTFFWRLITQSSNYVIYKHCTIMVKQCYCIYLTSDQIWISEEPKWFHCLISMAMTSNTIPRHITNWRQYSSKWSHVENEHIASLVPKLTIHTTDVNMACLV